MADVLNVSERTDVGKRRIRRLRARGQTPLVLYGHGEGSVSLSAPTSEVNAAIRHGSRLVDLGGSVNQSALVQSVQWDVFGAEVLHLDLMRVKKGERVSVTLPLELRGEAPGAKEGGVVEHQLHEILVECPVTSIPQEIQVNINELHLGAAIHLREVPLPEGATLLSDEAEVVVQCVEPTPELEEEEAMAQPGEPEVIGEKKEEESDEEKK